MARRKPSRRRVEANRRCAAALLRLWATVLSVPTTAGRVWLEAMAPGTAFEVASEPSRGWILLPDGSASLRSASEQSQLS